MPALPSRAASQHKLIGCGATAGLVTGYRSRGQGASSDIAAVPSHAHVLPKGWVWRSITSLANSYSKLWLWEAAFCRMDETRNLRTNLAGLLVSPSRRSGFAAYPRHQTDDFLGDTSACTRTPQRQGRLEWLLLLSVCARAV